MGRKSDPKVDEAVDLVVLTSLTPKEAWLKAGEPNGEQGIQNIRRRARERKQASIEALNGSPPPPPPPPPALSSLAGSVGNMLAAKPRKNGEKVPFRLNSQQVDKQEAAEHAEKHAKERCFTDALKAASEEYHKQQMASSNANAAAIARLFNAALDPAVKQLDSQKIRHHVAQGLAGLSPPKRGRPRDVPDVVVALVATHTSMKQLSGDEQKPRRMKRSLLALVKDSPLESKLASANQQKKFFKRLRQHPAAGGGSALRAVPKVVTENRRWLWLTYDNVMRYLDGWRYFLLNEGFALDEPEVLADGSTAEVRACSHLCSFAALLLDGHHDNVLQGEVHTLSFSLSLSLSLSLLGGSSSQLGEASRVAARSHPPLIEQPAWRGLACCRSITSLSLSLSLCLDALAPHTLFPLHASLVCARSRSATG